LASVVVDGAAPVRTGNGRELGVAHAVLAAIAYLPLLLVNAPGRVAADTKSYLYLDPAKLLARAPSMWDPAVGMGTVTHQNIGYVFPMGPYYWLLEQVGLPDWVAQRLWLGTLVFAAGAGMLFLFRSIGLRGGPAVAGAVVYMLSPYLLDYAARISVILMPWSALPWMVAFCIRGVRRGGWLHPALFAITVALIGGVNATALLLAGIGPVLWFPYAVWVTREATLRKALACAGRIGVLTLALSLWWISGLRTQGAYGINILQYTETYEAVAKTSSAPEVLRGLGYWFFYGSDKLGPWIEPGRQYAEQEWLLVVGYAIPALALFAALFTRWRHRAYAAGLVFVGLVMSVGAHPFDSPTPIGHALKALISSGPGMALRSTPRAVPLVVLGLAMFLAFGLQALHAAAPRCARWGWAPRQARWGTGLVMALTVLNMPPLFTGDVYGTNLMRDEDIPAYWHEAAAALDAEPHDTRVLELPGSDFASYRWGNTVDPVTPGLMDRPYVARELIPYGSAASAALLNAFDRRLQEGTFEPAALAPFARLISAATVVLRNDLQYERYRTPRPRILWDQVRSAPGIGEPSSAGPTDRNTPIPRLPLRDETELNAPPNLPDPPAVGWFPVAGAPSIVRAVPAERPVLLVGDADGLVNVAAAGMLDDPGLVLLAAGTSEQQREQALSDGAHVVITDTNRRQARRWGTVRENLGATEQAGEEPLEDDPSDNRLEVFPDQTDDDMTVAQHRGLVSVRATAYGNPVSYTAEDRAVHALDDDVRTAWRVGAFADVTGERLVVETTQPTTTDHVQVLQPVTGPRNRWITEVRLWFDGADPIDLRLDDSSRAEPGQRLTFPQRTFQRLDVEILQTDLGRQPRYDGISGVGIAHLDIPGPDGAPLRADEHLRLPTDVPSYGDVNRVSVVLSRERANPSEPVRSDPEAAIVRSFTLPAGRTFTIGGTARLSPNAADAVIDLVTGTSGDAVYFSSGRMPGSPTNRASAAFDGDPTSAWRTSFVFVGGQWNEVRLPQSVTFDRLDMQVVADGRHSVPTVVEVSADGGAPVRLDVPPIVDGADEGHLVAVPLALPAPLSGSVLRFTVLEYRNVETIDYYGERPITMPVAVAEWGVPGVRTAAPLDGTPDPACRSDLLTVDGAPVPVSVVPAGDVFAVRGCAPITLTPGIHDVRTAKGMDIGVDIDRLVLDSAPPAAADSAPTSAAPSPDVPAVTVVDEGRTSSTVRVGASAEPVWLVLGQSHNPGWTASVVDGGDLGAPTLVQGYANGWLLPAGPERTIELRWTPQRIVWAALAISAAGFLLCLGIALGALLMDRRRSAARAWAAGSTDEGVAVVASGTDPTGAAIGWPVGVAIIVLAGLAGGPLSAVAVAGALVVLRRFPGRRWVIGVVPSLLIVTVVAYMVALQIRFRLPAGFEWPSYFVATGPLGWMAVTVMSAVVAVETISERKGLRSPVVPSPVDGGTPNSQG
jgi:arabinofuranan 3-O-arabinosyltransferase